MWLEFKRRKWNIRAGRQRINWGITNMWNPNDLFNSYNFLDFDYEERPGSDAIKGQFIISDFSNVEVAVAGTSGGTVMAAKYFTNYRHYDLQWNAGLYQGVITAGFGWAGNIKGAGFKGELQYYGDKNDSLSHFLATLESDYVFKSGWYVSAGILYNEKGIAHPLNVYNGLIFRVTPRNLIPTRWNLVLNARKEFTPIFSGSLTTVYAPGTNLLILFPSLHRNLKPNWDIDLIWQSVFVESTSFQDLNHTLFLRSRWSF
ncbi:hypothetical protein [Chitinophaga jiangningensis]|nr:hypothetical protein [Chitinophaga jiangningensis]